MALIVEDGTGLADADSYISLADARTYAENYGYSLPATDPEAEILIRQGTLDVDANEMKGSKLLDTQSLSVPRVDVYCDGYLKDIDYQLLVAGRASVIYASARFGGASVRGIDNGKEVKLEEVPNAVKREFFESGSTGATVTVTEAEDMLKCLVDNQGNGLTFGVYRR